MRSLLLNTAAVVVILGLAMAFPWLKIPLILSLCYGLAALGGVVLLKAGQISFGHAMYACISGYVVAFVGNRYPDADGILLIAHGTLASVVAGVESVSSVAAPVGASIWLVWRGLKRTLANVDHFVPGRTLIPVAPITLNVAGGVVARRQMNAVHNLSHDRGSWSML